MEANIQSIADKILHATTLTPPSANNNEALEKKVDQIKNNMKSMIRKIL